MEQDLYKNVITLTGSIGSGKSRVAEIFKSLGAKVISADILARVAVKANTPAFKEIVKEFGQGVVSDRGEIDRKALGKIVFNNPRKRKILEAIVHPVVQKLAQIEFQQAINSKAHLIIYECPLLFETGLDKLGFKNIISVTSTEDVLLSRIIKRDKITKEEAIKRLKSQLNSEIKNVKSDFIIENNGTLKELEQKTKELYQKLIS